MGTDQTTMRSDLTSEKDYTSKTVLVRVTDGKDKVPNGLSRHRDQWEDSYPRSVGNGRPRHRYITGLRLSSTE